MKGFVGRYSGLFLTRRMLFYAVLVTAPFAMWGKRPSALDAPAKWENLFCFLFLGILGKRPVLCGLEYGDPAHRPCEYEQLYLPEPLCHHGGGGHRAEGADHGSGFVGAVLIVGGIIVSEYSGKRPFFGAFYPKEYRDSTYGIDFEELYRRGYRGILFDIDNTLVPHDAPATQESVELFRRLHAIGFTPA